MTEKYRLDPPYPIDNLADGLRKAREFRGMSLKTCSKIAGIPSSKLQNYEKGKYIPSLPEVESFSFIYMVPLPVLFFPGNFPDFFKVPDEENLQQLMAIRQHIISTKLQIAFENSSLSLKEFSKKSGLSLTKIKRYLGGASTIPLDDLQNLSTVLSLNVKDLLDLESPVGLWQEIQRKKYNYSELPVYVQDFINKAENWPYMEAIGLIKQIDTEKLEAIANSITNLVNVNAVNQERSDNFGD